jgi:hypothetical protein
MTENDKIMFKGMLVRKEVLFEAMKLSIMDSLATKRPDDIFENPTESFVIAQAIAELYGWFAMGLEIHSDQLKEMFINLCADRHNEYQEITKEILK